MPIDNSIYFQQQTPDIFGSIERGMRLMDMVDSRREANRVRSEQDALRKAAQQNVVQGEDGSFSLNRGGYLSSLAKIDPMKAMEAKKAFEADDLQRENTKRQRAMQDLDDNLKKATTLGNLFGSATDQQSYDQVRQHAVGMGLIDENSLPPQFDPGFVRNMQGRALTLKDRFEQEAKLRDEGRKDQELNLKGQELGIKRTDADTRSRIAQQKSAGGEALPIDKKKYVETLAVKNANKTAIKNQIDAVMGNWDKLPDDQKVAAGRQLLKTLNSTEGADAIGTEEAKRLGSKLEYALGNLFNSNPVQFGRDLPGFKDQANALSSSIGGAISANQNQIDTALGRRTSAPSPVGGQTFKTNEIEWAD